MAGELKTALVIGYTGATGREVVKALVETQRFEKVVLVGRRKVEFKDEPRIEELVSCACMLILLVNPKLPRSLFTHS